MRLKSKFFFEFRDAAPWGDSAGVALVHSVGSRTLARHESQRLSRTESGGHLRTARRPPVVVSPHSRFADRLMDAAALSPRVPARGQRERRRFKVE